MSKGRFRARFFTYCFTFFILASLCLFDDSLFEEAKAQTKGAFSQQFDSLLAHSANSGFVLYDPESKRILYERDARRPLKPASILKLVTTGAAFRELGSEYEFKTRVFGRRLQGGEAGEIYLRGGGAPDLTIENLWLLARTLKLRGVSSIGKLYIDSSAFRGAAERSGQRAYQAGSSALAFNFNSLSFHVCPGASGAPARIVVDPFEFPVRIDGSIQTVSRGAGQFRLDEIPHQRKQAFSAPLYRVSGTFGVNRSCEYVYRSLSDVDDFVGTVFQRLLERLGVRVREGHQIGKTPSDSALIYTLESKPLVQIIRDLNHYSSNFISEQMLMALGELAPGEFEREFGLRKMEGYLQSLGVPEGEYTLHDASGLSHKNRLSAYAVLQVLLDAERSVAWDVEFARSLAVSGRSGTLRKRRFTPIVRAKTGTINGVKSLAGHVVTDDARRFLFVLIQNKVPSGADAARLEERLVDRISKISRS